MAGFLGDFTATSNGTIVLTRDGFFQISGCATFDGDLVLVLENAPDEEYVKQVANYSCLFAVFTSVSVQLYVAFFFFVFFRGAL